VQIGRAGGGGGSPKSERSEIVPRVVSVKINAGPSDALCHGNDIAIYHLIFAIRAEFAKRERKRERERERERERVFRSKCSLSFFSPFI